MRQNARLLAAAAVPLLVASVVLSYLARNSTGGPVAFAGAVLGVGLVLTGVSLRLMVEAEGRLDGLVVPDSHAAVLASTARLPAPSWWGAASAAAGVVLLCGLFLSAALAGFGAGLLVCALLAGVVRAVAGYQLRRAEQADPHAPAPLDRPTVSAARRIQAFADEHGDLALATAVIAYHGRYGARVVLVGADGRIGDQVLASQARAQLACALAGVATADSWSRELTASAHNTVLEWSFMGGHTIRPQQPARPPVQHLA